jgi:phosphoglycerol transferase MdoB-like AlkP superfamily enzyme
VLVYSCLEELAKERPLTHSYSFAQIDDSDFRQDLSHPSAAAAADAREKVSAHPAYRGPRAKNILLIVMESTGVEYFGVQGSKYATTPNLDKLARDHGIVFENIYTQAASSCKSLVSLSASVYPRPDWLLIVRDHPEFDVPTIGQVLKERGYRTCYAHAGYWSWQNRDVFLRSRGVDKLIGAEGHEADAVNSWGIEDNTMDQASLFSPLLTRSKRITRTWLRR